MLCGNRMLGEGVTNSGAGQGSAVVWENLPKLSEGSTPNACGDDQNGPNSCAYGQLPMAKVMILTDPSFSAGGSGTYTGGTLPIQGDNVSQGVAELTVSWSGALVKGTMAQDLCDVMHAANRGALMFWRADGGLTEVGSLEFYGLGAMADADSGELMLMATDTDGLMLKAQDL